MLLAADDDDEDDSLARQRGRIQDREGGQTGKGRIYKSRKCWVVMCRFANGLAEASVRVKVTPKEQQTVTSDQVVLTRIYLCCC